MKPSIVERRFDLFNQDWFQMQFTTCDAERTAEMALQWRGVDRRSFVQKPAHFLPLTQ